MRAQEEQRVFQRWQKALSLPRRDGTAAETLKSSKKTATTVGVGLLLGMLYADVVWLGAVSELRLRPVWTGEDFWFLGAFLAFGLVNGWVLRAVLRARHPLEARALGLLFVLASTPFAGFWLLPWSRALAAGRKDTPSRPLRLVRASWSASSFFRAARTLHSSKGWIFLWATHLAVCCLLGWLLSSTADRLGLVGLLSMAAWVGVSHGLAGACLAWHAWIDVRERRQGELRWLWPPLVLVVALIPLPVFPLLGILLLWMSQEVLGPPPSMLVGRAYDSRRVADRHSVWRRLRDRLFKARDRFPKRLRRRLAARWAPKSAGLSRRETAAWRLRLWKTSLVPIDAAFVTGLFVGWFPGSVASVSRLVAAAAFVLGSLAWIACGWLSLIRGLRGFGETGEARRRFLGSLGTTQLGLAVGVWLGLHVHLGDRQEVAALIAVLGLAGALAGFGRTMLEDSWFLSRPAPPSAKHFPVLGILSSIFVAYLGLGLYRGKVEMDPFWEMLTVFLTWGPVLGMLGSARWVRSWLIPWDAVLVRKRSLPARLRLRLWVLILTAVGPLGGLAIPFWSRIRPPAPS